MFSTAFGTHSDWIPGNSLLHRMGVIPLVPVNIGFHGQSWRLLQRLQMKVNPCASLWTSVVILLRSYTCTCTLPRLRNSMKASWENLLSHWMMMSHGVVGLSLLHTCLPTRCIVQILLVEAPQTNCYLQLKRQVDPHVRPLSMLWRFTR